MTIFPTFFHMADELVSDTNPPKATLCLAGKPSSPLVVTSKKSGRTALHSDTSHMREAEPRTPTYSNNFVGSDPRAVD